jgi:uncharacterized coiled-coil protein SlyX
MAEITLEFLGNRVAALTDDMRDLKLRMTALEARFGAIEARLGGLEGRFDTQEQRMSAMLNILVRIAERQGIAPT